jgi:hypothetical protein
MAEAKLDELVAWSFDARGRIDGFAGARQPHRLSRLSRFLLPGLDSGFAAPGDLLKIERVPFFRSEISGLANLTRRRAEMPDPLRSALFAALVLALPLPAVIAGGRWWLLILSATAAAAVLLLLFDSRSVLRKAASDERAAETLNRWHYLRSHLVPADAPSFTVREEPEPDWVDLLDRAYAGTLADHEAVEIGALPVPDGKLLACEPFQIHDPRRYTVAVPPGTYPVFISIAAAPDGTDQRVAYAWVRLRQGAPARWEPARTRPGEEVSVGVDSGIACFTSAAAAARLVVGCDRGGRWGYNEPLSDTLVKAMDEVWRDTRGWAVIEAGQGGRLAAFSSGFGDGVYPVYRALDSRGRRLAVAMVFFVDW